jgi:tetratricopeptide (TPR) repeat protein
MYRLIILFVGLICIVRICSAQDSITINDVKVIKAKSEITIERYFNSLLNTISYAGAESTDIKELISRSIEDSDRKIFLSGQIAIADDISDPDYSNSSNSPDLPVTRYLNAFNTFYGKSDANSVNFSDVRSSRVKKGKKNIYVNVYFTSFFKNKCLAKPVVPYKPTKRVAEIFVKRGPGNKWLLYISRIGFFNPADTVNDLLDNIAIRDAGMEFNLSGRTGEAADKVEKFNQYIDQARTEEKKRNYPAAISLYSMAINLMPEKKDMYVIRVRELNTASGVLAGPEEKYRKGYYSVAIKEYSELLKSPTLNSDFSNSDYFLGRAKCFDKIGQLTKSYNEMVKNYQEALRNYNKSLEYDKDNLETIRCLEDLHRRMNSHLIEGLSK